MLSPLPRSLSGYTIRAGVDTAIQTSFLTPAGTRWAQGRRSVRGILQNGSCHIYLGLLQSQVEASGRAHKRTIQGSPAPETKQMLRGSLQRPRHRRLAKLLSQIRAHLLGSTGSPRAVPCQRHCWEGGQSGGQSLAGNRDAELNQSSEVTRAFKLFHQVWLVRSMWLFFFPLSLSWQIKEWNGKAKPPI